MASEQRHVDVWRRRGTKWEVEDLIGDAALELEAVGLTIPWQRSTPTAAFRSGAFDDRAVEPKLLNAEADVIAPDGCEVRLLAQPRAAAWRISASGRAGRARGRHRTVEELWYFLGGPGPDVAPAGRADEEIEGSRSRSRSGPGSSCATTAPKGSPRSRSRCRPGQARTRPTSCGPGSEGAAPKGQGEREGGRAQSAREAAEGLGGDGDTTDRRKGHGKGGGGEPGSGPGGGEGRQTRPRSSAPARAAPVAAAQHARCGRSGAASVSARRLWRR